MGFGVYGQEFRGQGLEFRVQFVLFGIQGLRFRISGFGCWVSGYIDDQPCLLESDQCQQQPAWEWGVRGEGWWFVL